MYGSQNKMLQLRLTSKLEFISCETFKAVSVSDFMDVYS